MPLKEACLKNDQQKNPALLSKMMALLDVSAALLEKIDFGI